MGSGTDASQTASGFKNGLRFEEQRLQSFISWPVQSPIHKKSLARAGFYYSGHGTEVTCFCCGGKISEWNFGDKAIEKHRRFYPNCPFVRDGADNVPYLGTQDPFNCPETLEAADKEQRPLNHRLGITSQDSQACRTPSRNSALGNATFHPLASGEKNLPNSFDQASAGGENSPATYRMLETKAMWKAMKKEAERLQTFSHGWPLPFVSPSELARAGFYYLGVNDKVRCPFCDGVLTNWERGDRPMAEHAKNFPLCPFVLGRPVGNECLNLWDLPASVNSPGEDVCGKYTQSGTSIQQQHKVLDQAKQHLELKEYGIEAHQGPQHPSQASKDARLRSFQGWPADSSIRPDSLADAGFFYIGISDHTKCFYCDGGLCNWEVGDEPWTEHARWFCNCTFVRLNKGEAFIKVCLGSSREDLTNSPTSMSAVPPVVSAIQQKVDQVMKSNMLTAFLATGLYQPSLVHQAVLSLVQETGDGPAHLDQLTEAIHLVQAIHRPSVPSLQPTQQPGECLAQLEETFNIRGQTTLVQPATKNAQPPKMREVIPGVSSALEEENRLLKEQRMCKICMDQEVGVVFLPCGHFIACTQCAPALRDCALCRTPIKGTIRTFLS